MGLAERDPDTGGGEGAEAPAAATHDRAAVIHAGVAVLSWLHRRWVLFVYGLLAGLSLLAAVLWLKVDTDPSRMISPDLSFRRDYQRLIAAFPQLDNAMILLVEGQDPKAVRTTAEALTESFKARPDLFSHVLAPALSPMFSDYGPLYLSLPALERLTAQLAQAAPMLRLLAERPDMEGMTRLLGGMLRQKPSALAGSDGLRRLFTAMSKAVRTVQEGRARPMDWTALGGIEGREEPRRIFILVKPRLDFSRLDPAAEAMAEAKRIIADPEARDGRGVRVWLTGEAAMNAEEFSTITRGAIIAGVLSFLIVSGVVLLGLPSRRLLIAVIALIIIGFALNAGFATLSVGSLNMISVAFAVLFIGLGVDYAVHFLLRWAEEARMPPNDEPRPLARAAAATGPALAMSALTTVLAFLAFWPTDFIGMTQLGIIAAGGIVIAYVGTLTLVAAVLGLLPRSSRLVAPRKEGRISRWRHLLPAKAAWRIRQAVTLLVLLLAAGSIVFLPKVRFDGDPVNLKDPAAPSVRAYAVLLQEEPRLVQAVSALASGREEAEKLARLLKDLPEVGEVITALSFLPERQTDKLALLRALARQLPDSVRLRQEDIGHKRRIAALRQMIGLLARMERLEAYAPDLRKAAGALRQRLEAFLQNKGKDKKAVAALEAAWFVRLPELINGLQRLVRTGPLTVENMDPALKRWYIAEDGRWRVEAAPARRLSTDAEMRAFALAIRRVAPQATGAPVEITGAASVVSRAMIAAMLLALGGVIVVVGIMTRSALAVVLALAPILLAAILLLAYTVIFDAPFNFANVIVLPLLLGLGVDSSIHYLHRAREAASGSAVLDTSTPRAIVISALTTMGSFGTLWLTPHRGLSSMGELLTVAIALMLLCTLVVMPQLIDWAVRWKKA